MSTATATDSMRLDIPGTGRDAARIAKFLDTCTDTPACADLVFVFGTRHLEPAHLAAGLVSRGIGRFVVLTGGRNRLTGVQEANAHLDVLLEKGVPQDRVIMETESTNTLENVVLALPRVSSRLALAELKSIIVVTKWYHCRRAMMTLKRQLPAGIRYFAETYEPAGMSRSDWWQSEDAVRRVERECSGISKYLELGHIAEVREESGAYV